MAGKKKKVPEKKDAGNTHPKNSIQDEADEALQERQEWYRTVFENTGTATVVVEENNIITFANAEFTNLSGFSKNDIEGKKCWTDFVVKEDLERMLAQHRLRRQNREKALTHYEFRFVTKSGDIRNIYLTIDVISGTKKSVASLLDITERKRAEEQIRWLAGFPELNPNPVFEMDTQGTITYANAATLNTLRDLGLPENPALFVSENKEDILRMLKETGALQVYREITLNNETFAENISLNHTLRVVRFYIHNITNSKRAEEALRESEEKYRNIFDNAIEGIYQATPEGRFISANLAAARILGYDSSDELMRSVTDIRSQIYAYPDDRDRAVKIIKETGILKDFEVQCRHKNGSIVWVAFNVKPIRNAEGTILYHEGTSQDITKRKVAEEKLRASEEKYRLLSERSPDHVIVQDLDLRYVYVLNPQLGLKLEDMIGRTDYDFLEKEDADKLTQIKREVIRTGTAAKYETFLISRNGVKEYFEGTYVPKINKDGKIEGLAGYFRNVTERKRVEEVLRKERDFANSIVGTAQAIFLILDTKGHIVYFNPYMVEISGYSLDELKGKDWFETFLPSRTQEYTRSLFQKAIGDIQTRGNVNAIITKDGREHLIEWYDKTLKGADGSIEGLLSVGQDVTDKKIAEEALQESEERYRTLAEASPDQIFIVGRDDTMKYVNSTALRLFHRSHDQVIGTSRKNLFPPDIADSQGILLKKAFETGEQVHTAERIQFGTRELWIDTFMVPLKDTEGNVTSVLGIARDITEHKRAEDTIRKFSEDLEKQVTERTADISDINQKLVAEIDIRLDAEKQLNKTVGEKEVLLREVHHRVKNNLQIIISLLNLQSRYMTDETTLAAFRESQNRIKAMALVHEKLYQSTDILKINLDDYIRFLGDNLFKFYGMKGKGSTLTRDISNISLAIDIAIPVGLIINELISNSLKYAFPDGRKGMVSIAIHRQDHTLTILFKDNGVGIPQDFDWRDAKSLGLRLVISLVEQLQGTIELKKEKGTTFNIVVKEKE